MRLLWIASIVVLVAGTPCRAENSVKEAGKEIGQGFKKIGQDTGTAFKEGGKEVGQGFRDLGKETGQAAKKAGRSVGDWFRDLGRSFKSFFTGA